MSFTRFVMLAFGMTALIVRTRSAEYTRSSNITSIPPEAYPGDPVLIFEENAITHIPADAFISYSNLKILAFFYVPLEYIEEGAFSGQNKLEKLRIDVGNKKLLFPLNLGPPTKSLTSIIVWGSLSAKTSLGCPYFAAFERLKYLNIGLNYLNISNADLLPSDLTEFYAPYNEIPIFPNVGTYDPLIQDIRFDLCGMRYIPVSSVSGLREVKLLYLSQNTLSNLPDITFMKVLEEL